MPLAFCITELDRGGAELAMCEIAVRLDKRKFQPVVYCLQPRPENETASCVGMLGEAGITVHFLNMRGIRDFPFAFWKLRKHLKKQKPTVFLSFLFHANIIGRIAAYAAGVPHVFSGIRVAEKQASWHLRLDRFTDRLVEKHICVSRSVAEFSAMNSRLPKEKIVVIPNGIDIAKFTNVEKADLSSLETVKDSKKAVFIGRIHPQKGIDWLLETCAIWLQKLPDWELLIVGKESDKTFAQKCIENRNQLGETGKRVHFTGWRADVPQLLAASDLVILPSRWEGMPNVILQAMCSERPILASMVEGIDEILGEDLVGSQTVPFGDTDAFCEKLYKIATDVGLAHEIAKKNRQRVEQCFDIQNVVESYAKLFSCRSAAER